jgi:replicative DNA helicase
LKQRGNPIDILTVSNELKKGNRLDQVGGVYHLTQLTNSIASSAHAEFHARVVLERYLSREIINLASETLNKAFDTSISVDDLFIHNQKELIRLTEMIAGNNNRTLIDIISQSLDEIHKVKENPETSFGVPTPLSELNNITGGWQRGDLIILAGRPSRGKTAFALANIRSACEAGKSAVIFSIEMKDTQLMKRLIWSFGTDPDEAGGIISRWDLSIDEKPNIGVPYIVNNCRAIKRTKGLDFVVIDYLGLMDLPKGDNRAYQIGDITRALKNMAKEMDVPVFLLCQLSREIEKRGKKKHELSDLRDSGNIEQDADIVLFISRPFLDGTLSDKNDESTEFLTVLEVAKNRNGKCPVTIKARHNEKVNHYEDWEAKEYLGYFGGSQPQGEPF